jgi:hypothetical protein
MMPITFEVTELVSWINKNLERTDEFANQPFKEGLRNALDQVLTYQQDNVNVDDFKEWTNQQLKSVDFNDKHKAALCITIEHILLAAHHYKGYNDNYWVQKGCREWFAAGQPEGEEKNKYMYGPTGQQYNRHYY